MGCTITYKNSLNEQEFKCDNYKQKILIKILLEYSEYNMKQIANALDLSINKLQDILNLNIS